MVHKVYGENKVMSWFLDRLQTVLIKAILLDYYRIFIDLFLSNFPFVSFCTFTSSFFYRH